MTAVNSSTPPYTHTHTMWSLTPNVTVKTAYFLTDKIMVKTYVNISVKISRFLASHLFDTK